MATLNMGRSYALTRDEINKNIDDNRIGNYALGYINEQGMFIVKYVGRSDVNLRMRILHGIVDMQKDPTHRYERFKFSYADSALEAYEKECRNYHDFGGIEGLLLNKTHPDKPVGTDCLCPICDVSIPNYFDFFK